MAARLRHDLPDPRRTSGRALRAAGPAAVAGLSLLLASCGEDHLAVFPVSGTMKVGNEVPEGAQIALYPLSRSLPENIIPVGKVAADGTFKIGTYDVADGAPAGDYKATIQWFKVVKSDGGVGRGPNVLSRDYSDPEKTPVTVKVAEGANDLPPIVIKK